MFSSISESPNLINPPNLFDPSYPNLVFVNVFLNFRLAYFDLMTFSYDGATVSKMLADKWKTLNQEQKQVFYTEADHLKNLHQLQHPDYK